MPLDESADADLALAVEGGAALRELLIAARETDAATFAALLRERMQAPPVVAVGELGAAAHRALRDLDAWWKSGSDLRTTTRFARSLCDYLRALARADEASRRYRQASAD